MSRRSSAPRLAEQQERAAELRAIADLLPSLVRDWQLGELAPTAHPATELISGLEAQWAFWDDLLGSGPPTNPVAVFPDLAVLFALLSRLDPGRSATITAAGTRSRVLTRPESLTQLTAIGSPVFGTTTPGIELRTVASARGWLLAEPGMFAVLPLHWDDPTPETIVVTPRTHRRRRADRVLRGAVARVRPAAGQAVGVGSRPVPPRAGPLRRRDRGGPRLVGAHRASADRGGIHRSRYRVALRARGRLGTPAMILDPDALATLAALLRARPTTAQQLAHAAPLPSARFRPAVESLVREGFLEVDGDEVRVLPPDTVLAARAARVLAASAADRHRATDGPRDPASLAWAASGITRRAAARHPCPSSWCTGCTTSGSCGCG